LIFGIFGIFGINVTGTQFLEREVQTNIKTFIFFFDYQLFGYFWYFLN